MTSSVLWCPRKALVTASLVLGMSLWATLSGESVLITASCSAPVGIVTGVPMALLTRWQIEREISHELTPWSQR